MNRIRQLFASLSRRKLVGTDPLGNKYFEEAAAHYGKGRNRRTVTMNRIDLADSMNPQLYRSDMIPAQWRSWLTHTRQEPPTFEEVADDLQRQEIVRERAKQLDIQWQKRKEELLKGEEYRLLHDKIRNENDTGLVGNEEGHDKTEEIPAEALQTGRGTTFQPGQWTPPKQ